MTPDEMRLLSGFIVLIGFFGLGRQCHWQVRVSLMENDNGAWYKRLWQTDLQTKGTFIFLVLMTVTFGQYALALLGIAPFGSTERGVVVLALLVVSILWWNFCTERHNATALRRIREAKERLRRPLG